MIEYLQKTSVELCKKWQAECIEVNGEENHLHVVFRYAPQMQLSKFISNFKSVSSRKVRKKFEPELKKFYWDWSKGFWSDGYSIDSVSGNAASQAAYSTLTWKVGLAPLEVLKKYVQNQGKEVRLRGIEPLDSQAFHPDPVSFAYRAGILTLKG